MRSRHARCVSPHTDRDLCPRASAVARGLHVSCLHTPSQARDPQCLCKIQHRGLGSYSAATPAGGRRARSLLGPVALSSAGAATSDSD
eukprot:6208760-Pleurochrysis_carterae.AAC.2